MLRKNKVWMYIIGAGTLLGIIIPTLFNIYFSKQLLWFTQLRYCFLPILAFVFLFKIFRKKINIDNARKIPFVPWLILISMIVLGSSLLFISQASLLLKDASGFNHIKSTQAPFLLHDLIQSLFGSFSFFPWSMITLVAVIFVIRGMKGEYIYPFSGFLPKLKSAQLFRLIRKNISLYVDISTRIFIASAIAFLVIETYQMLSLPQINTIPGCITFLALLLVSKNEQFKKLDDIFGRIKFPPILMLVLIGLITFIVVAVMQFILIIVNRFTLGYLVPLFSNTSRPLAFVHETWMTAWQLWQWAWWVLATPFLASLLVKISHEKSLRVFILTLLIIPCLFLLAWHFLNSTTILYLISQLLSMPTIFTLQLILLIILLLFFIPIKSHHTLLLGFFPLKNPPKLRLLPFKRTYLTVVALLGILIMSSIQGLLMLQLLVAIGAFVVYLMMGLKK
jgi:choline-glycine betaine transporter